MSHWIRTTNETSHSPEAARARGSSGRRPVTGRPRLPDEGAPRREGSLGRILRRGVLVIGLAALSSAATGCPSSCSEPPPPAACGNGEVAVATDFAGKATAIAAGHDAMCALLGGDAPKRLFCWSETGPHAAARVEPLERVAAVSIGWGYPCALFGGNVKCWGGSAHAEEARDLAIIPAYSELCDDGNTTNGDGCSSVCAIEPDYLLMSTI